MILQTTIIASIPKHRDAIGLVEEVDADVWVEATMDANGEIDTLQFYDMESNPVALHEEDEIEAVAAIHEMIGAQNEVG